MRFGILVVASLLAVSEVVPNGTLDPIARLGATGMLGAILFYLIAKTIPRMSRDFKELVDILCQRHDSWEKIRHEDHQRLEELLMELKRKE